MTIVIQFAGYLESTLNNDGEPVGRYEYESVDSALAALVSAGLPDEACLYQTDTDGWYVYRSPEERDEDLDGAAAVAVIVSS